MTSHSTVPARVHTGRSRLNMGICPSCNKGPSMHSHAGTLGGEHREALSIPTRESLLPFEMASEFGLELGNGKPQDYAMTNNLSSLHITTKRGPTRTTTSCGQWVMGLPSSHGGSRGRRTIHDSLDRLESCRRPRAYVIVRKHQSTYFLCPAVGTLRCPCGWLSESRAPISERCFHLTASP